jgi:hypothetical protein
VPRRARGATARAATGAGAGAFAGIAAGAGVAAAGAGAFAPSPSKRGVFQPAWLNICVFGSIAAPIPTASRQRGSDGRAQLRAHRLRGALVGVGIAARVQEAQQVDVRVQVGGLLLDGILQGLERALAVGGRGRGRRRDHRRGLAGRHDHRRSRGRLDAHTGLAGLGDRGLQRFVVGQAALGGVAVLGRRRLAAAL